MLHEISRNLIVNGFVEGTPASFTIDMGTTVSTVCPDIVSCLQPQLSYFTLQTVTGSQVKVLGRVDICLHLGLLEFSDQILLYTLSIR